MQFRIPKHGMVLPAVRESAPSSIRLCWKCSRRRPRRVSKLTLNPVRLTMKINHHGRSRNAIPTGGDVKPAGHAQAAGSTQKNETLVLPAGYCTSGAVNTQSYGPCGEGRWLPLNVERKEGPDLGGCDG